MKARFWPDIVEYFQNLNNVDNFSDKLGERMNRAETDARRQPRKRADAPKRRRKST
jgi:hypothetical protein